jgi:hypothetical protein
MEHRRRDGVQDPLFLEAGAVEVWIVAEDGSWKVFDERGEQRATRDGVTLEFPAV